MELTAAVVFVSDLDRSTDFYREVLDLSVEIATGDAVLLSSTTGRYLVLRALHGADHFSGVLGLQYLIWTAEDPHDLGVCEQVLRDRGAFVATWTDDVTTLVEGHDPDRAPVMIGSSPDPAVSATSLLSRLLAY